MNDIFNFFYNFKNINYVNLAISVLIIVIFQILSKTLTKLVLKILNIKPKKKKDISELEIFSPVNSFFKVLGIYLAILYLRVPNDIWLVVNKIFSVTLIFIFARTFSSLLNEDSNFVKKIQNKFEIAKGNSAISILTKAGQIIIYIIAIFLILYKLGYNLGGLLTSFGVLGVIITFAAQDTAKNLFGGFVILLDKPFIVGDWIQIGEIEGIVEDLSLRSTRIRTFKDALITIPNSTISNESIINWSKMKIRKITFDIEFELSTPLIKVNDVIDKIYLMLQEHPNVLNKDLQVHFEKITENGYSIRISYFVQNTTYIDYLNIRQNVNYKLIQTLENSKVLLAYPSRSIYLKK